MRQTKLTKNTQTNAAPRYAETPEAATKQTKRSPNGMQKVRANNSFTGKHGMCDKKTHRGWTRELQQIYLSNTCAREAND